MFQNIDPSALKSFRELLPQVDHTALLRSAEQLGIDPSLDVSALTEELLSQIDLNPVITGLMNELSTPVGVPPNPPPIEEDPDMISITWEGNTPVSGWPGSGTDGGGQLIAGANDYFSWHCYEGEITHVRIFKTIFPPAHIDYPTNVKTGESGTHYGTYVGYDVQIKPGTRYKLDATRL